MVVKGQKRADIEMLTVYVHFGVLKFKEKARLAPLGGVFDSSWRARRQQCLQYVSALSAEC